MKRMNKFFTLMLGVTAFALASCDDGNVGTIYEQPAEEQGYGFLTESAGASFKPGYDQEEYIVKLARNFAGEAATIDVTNDCEDEFFTIPTSVTFEAGETMADIVIGIAGMATGQSYSFTLAIDSCNLSKQGENFGIAETEISFGVDYSWSTIGVVAATDDWSGAEAEVELQVAPEYVSSANEMLVRLVSLEYMLEPAYADEGNHFMFYLDKTTYEPLGTASVVQSMGEADSSKGNYYWIYSPSSGHTFTKEANVYSLSGYVGYDSFGSSVSAGWYYNLEFTWTEGYPLDDIPEEGGDEEGDEEETETGNGFGAIVAGGDAEAYEGTYTATFMNGKKEQTATVTLTKVDDNTVCMKGLVADTRYGLVDNGIMLDVYGGLLYFSTQTVGANNYADVYAAPYSSSSEYFYEDAMLVAGFKANGNIQFTNYTYNQFEDEDVVDGIIYVFDYDGGTYGGADYFPCDIELAPAQEGEAAPSKNVTSVVESLKAAKTYFNLPIAKQMSLKK